MHASRRCSPLQLHNPARHEQQGGDGDGGGRVNMEAEGTSSLTTETQPVLEELMAFNQHDVQMIYFWLFLPSIHYNVKF